MKTYDLSELALRNLRESSLRNSLTTIGISVGVASLVAMLSLGIGLQKLAYPPSGEVWTIRHRSRDLAPRMRGFSRDDERSTASAAESRTLDNRPGRKSNGCLMCSKLIRIFVSSPSFAIRTSRT